MNDYNSMLLSKQAVEHTVDESIPQIGEERVAVVVIYSLRN